MFISKLKKEDLTFKIYCLDKAILNLSKRSACKNETEDLSLKIDALIDYLNIKVYRRSENENPYKMKGPYDVAGNTAHVCRKCKSSMEDK